MPVENSLFFAEALRKNNINYGLHIYSEGGHGLSLSNEKWESGDFGEPYTMKQTVNVIDAIKNDVIDLDKNFKEMLLKQFEIFEGKGELEKRIAIKEVASWIELAFEWLKKSK